MEDTKLTPEITYALIKWATEDPETFKKFLAIAKAGGEPWEELKASIRRIADEIKE